MPADDPPSEAPMSVTFLPACSEDLATAVRDECVACDGSGKDPYDGGPCAYCDGAGFFEVQVYPHEINLSNGNAVVMMRALGFAHKDEHGYGSLSLDECRSALQRAIALAASDARAASFERKDEHTPRGWAGVQIVDDGSVARIQAMGPEIFARGLSVDDIQDRAERFIKLLDFAIRNGSGISWS